MHFDEEKSFTGTGTQTAGARHDICKLRLLQEALNRYDIKLSVSGIVPTDGAEEEACKHDA